MTYLSSRSDNFVPIRVKPYIYIYVMGVTTRCIGVSSCTGPMMVDREQNTMTDVAMVFILDQGMILNSSQSG